MDSVKILSLAALRAPGFPAALMAFDRLEQSACIDPARPPQADAVSATVGVPPDVAKERVGRGLELGCRFFEARSFEWRREPSHRRLSDAETEETPGDVSDLVPFVGYQKIELGEDEIRTRGGTEAKVREQQVIVAHDNLGLAGSPPRPRHETRLCVALALLAALLLVSRHLVPDAGPGLRIQLGHVAGLS